MFKLNLDGAQAFSLRSILDRINLADLYTDPKEIEFYNKQLARIKMELRKALSDQ